MKNVLILLNGEYGDYHFCSHHEAFDWVICADNGMHHARALGITPNLILGDFDSGNQEDLAFFREQDIKIETFNPKKDATDSEIAVDRAIQKGAERVTIWGGVGTRMDHSLANIQLLYKLLLLGIEGEIVNPYNRIRLVKDHCSLKGKAGQVVSLIPFVGEVSGVTTKNLEYPLNDAKMPYGNSLGISNVMCTDSAEIEVAQGVLMVIMAND